MRIAYVKLKNPTLGLKNRAPAGHFVLMQTYFLLITKIAMTTRRAK